MGKTSYEVKQRWKKANYIKIAFDMDKDDGLEFREKCKRENIPQAEVLKQAVYDFLGKPVPPSKAKF